MAETPEMGWQTYRLTPEIIPADDTETRCNAGRYAVKFRIGHVLRPTRLLGIGMGSGYSLHALLDANPGTECHVLETPPDPAEEPADVERRITHARHILQARGVRFHPYPGETGRAPVTADCIHLRGINLTLDACHNLELAWNSLAPGGVIVVDGFDRCGGIRTAVCSWLAARRDEVEARHLGGLRGDVLICGRKDAAARKKLRAFDDATPLLRVYERRTLLAGPHLGEFGFELCCWQAALRWRSCAYGSTSVLCPPGSSLLYQDFARINHIPAGGRFAVVNRRKDVDVIPANKRIAGYGRTWRETDLLRAKFHDQAFVLFDGPFEGEPFDVVLHARAREHRMKHNWREWRWNELVRRLSDLRVAVIGRADECLELQGPNVTDLRGIPMDQLAGLLRRGARLIAGTSSGPLHLAALCGCPQVVFTTTANHRRYRLHWNPWNTPFRFTPGGWKPTPEDAEERIRTLLETTAAKPTRTPPAILIKGGSGLIV